MTNEQLHELLNRACDIITSLEGYANEHSHYPEHNRELQRTIDNFFNEIDMLNEEDTGPEYDSAGFTEEDRIVNGQYRNTPITPYEKYVAEIKQNIDQAVADGILKSGTECMSYSYLSEEGFNQRVMNDLEFAARYGDPNWLFPGEPLHDYDPDAEAQDWDIFGEKKV